MAEHSRPRATKIQDIDQDYILDWCNEEGPEAIKWLQELMEQPVKDTKTGKHRKTLSFMEVRKEFVFKFHKELVDKKKLSFAEKVKLLG